MLVFRSTIKPVAYLVMLGFLTLSVHVPAVHAGLIGTETVVSTAQTQAARDQLRATLERQDVRQALLEQGVSPDQVQARVDSLTDAEAQQLAANMDSLPAAGDSFLGIAVFVFLVLLITDILGYTDIFPFVKKTAR